MLNVLTIVIMRLPIQNSYCIMLLMYESGQFFFIIPVLSCVIPFLITLMPFSIFPCSNFSFTGLRWSEAQSVRQLKKANSKCKHKT